MQCLLTNSSYTIDQIPTKLGEPVLKASTMTNYLKLLHKLKGVARPAQRPSMLCYINSQSQHHLLATGNVMFLHFYAFLMCWPDPPQIWTEMPHDIANAYTEGWEDALNAVTAAMLFQQHERKGYFQWVATVTMS